MEFIKKTPRRWKKYVGDSRVWHWMDASGASHNSDACVLTVVSWTLEKCWIMSIDSLPWIIKVAGYQISFLWRIWIKFNIWSSLSGDPSYCGRKPVQIICSILTFSKCLVVLGLQVEERKDAESLALLAFLQPTLLERTVCYRLSHENSVDVAGNQIGLELLVFGFH